MDKWADGNATCTYSAGRGRMKGRIKVREGRVHAGRMDKSMQGMKWKVKNSEQQATGVALPQALPGYDVPTV